MTSLQPIDLWELATNLMSGTVCLVMALVLLLFRTGNSIRLAGYGRVRRYLATAALFVVVLDAAIVMFILGDKDFTLLDAVFVPTMYYVQLHLSTVCLLLLIRSPRVRTYHRVWYTVPVTLLTTVHVVGYLVHTGCSTDYASYAAFVKTPFSMTISILLLTYIGLSLCRYIQLLWTESRRFERSIDDYFSGHAAVDGKTMGIILRCTVAYFTLAGADFVWGAFADTTASFRIANLVLVWVNTCVFILAGIVIINLHRAYYQVAPAFQLRESQPAAPTVPSENIEQSVRRWSQSAQKPYLREGLTLSSVADEMGIGPRLLSAYINKIHNQNFNSWVNGLRIEEVKRLLADQPTMTMSEIAVRTGFTDAPAMTKVFKRFVDLTPSTYRERAKNSAVPVTT